MSRERLKSIDIFRGLCMSWMILGHLFDWWLKADQNWIRSIMTILFEPVGASGFLFISGVSIALSYRNRLIKAKISDDYNFRMSRNSYFFRALFIFIIAIIYNSAIAIGLFNLQWIWTWFILLTIAISLFLSWPLLKISILIRFFLAISIIIFNQFLVTLLLPHRGGSNLYGFLYHFLYNDINLDPILYFFPFFLIGTVVGDMIYKAFYLENKDQNGERGKIKLLTTTSIFGICFILLGVLFNTPQFLIRRSFSWILYSLGFDLCLLTIFLVFEVLGILNTKKSYKFLFYYSFYSLTIYLAHNILYFLFLKQLNVFNIWFFIAATFIAVGVILRAIYKKWEGLASLKTQIGKLSSILTMKIEVRKRNQNSINHELKDLN